MTPKRRTLAKGYEIVCTTLFLNLRDRRKKQKMLQIGKSASVYSLTRRQKYWYEIEYL